MNNQYEEPRYSTWDDPNMDYPGEIDEASSHGASPEPNDSENDNASFQNKGGAFDINDNLGPGIIEKEAQYTRHVERQFVALRNREETLRIERNEIRVHADELATALRDLLADSRSLEIRHYAEVLLAVYEAFKKEAQ